MRVLEIDHPLVAHKLTVLRDATTHSSVFRQLADELVEIVDLEVAKLDKRLKDKDMGIELTEAAKNLLAKRGFDPVLGARPLRRTVQREIEDVLSEKILFGEIGAGEIITVDVDADEKFTFTPRPRPLPEDTFGEVEQDA